MALLGLQMILFVNEYAPVILVKDRWGSLSPLFYDRSFWEGFTHQHGPHRMGLAYILFNCTTTLSDWNGKWDMYVQAGIYIVSAFLAVRLKKKLSGRYQWTDLLIPMIFITMQSSSTVFVNPYVHGLIPFFALLISLSWFIRNHYLRWLSLSVLSAVALFSGFGLVAGSIFIAIELGYFIRNRNLRNLSAIILPVAGIIYIIATQKPGGEIALSSDWWLNLNYFLLLAGNYFFGGPIIWLFPVGLLFAAGFVSLLFLNKSLFFNGQISYSKVLTLLIGSSLFFMILNVLGRTGQGLASADSARYIPGTMTLMFGVYLLILKLVKDRTRIIFLCAFSFVILISQVKTLNVDAHVRHQHPQFEKWEACLRSNNNYEQCYRQIKFPLAGHPERTRIQEKLNFLKENNLSIFKEK